jgi:hypothetical protein
MVYSDLGYLGRTHAVKGINIMTISSVDFVESKLLAQSDARGRVTLGLIAKDKRFSVAFSQTGEILLTPVVTIPEREAWLYNNPAALAQVDRGIADAEAGRLVSLEAVLREAEGEAR